MNKKISVIVPVYNVEEYLHRCLDSILKQSLKELEIILVDDGSTDHSGDICDEYARAYDEIRVIHQENGGLAKARNTGMEAASGNYIAFVDSDDYLETQTYERLYNVAARENCDVVTCGYFLETKESVTPQKINLPANRLIDRKELDSLILRANKTRILWFAWKSIYKKSFLDKNSIWFNPELRFGEDSPFMLKVLFCCQSLFYVDEPLYHYYQSPNSLTRKKHRDGYIDLLYKIYVDKMQVYKTFLPEGGYEADMDSYTMTHVLPLLIANEMKNPGGIADVMRSYGSIRNNQMIKSAFSKGYVHLIKSKVKYLVLLLRYRLYLPLSVISKRR